MKDISKMGNALRYTRETVFISLSFIADQEKLS